MESVGWEVHNQVEDPDHFDEPPIEDIPGSAEEREKAVFDRLKDISADDGSHKKALIIYISHMGGHKYAGNVIVSDGLFLLTKNFTNGHLRYIYLKERGFGMGGYPRMRLLQ